MVDGRTVDFTGGQKARARKNGRRHIKKIELGQLTGRIKVGVEESFDCANIFPVALINV